MKKLLHIKNCQLRIGLIIFLLVINFNAFTQEKRPLFIGIQPGYTKEKFYDKNELDINVLPILLEFPVAKRVNLRFTSVLNYHLGQSANI